MTDDTKRSDTAVESCEAALKSIIALARAAVLEQSAVEKGATEKGAAEKGAAEPGARASAPSKQTRGASASGTPGARERLARALRELAPETALKLHTLMVAGRDGLSIHSVKINAAPGQGDAAFAAAGNSSGSDSSGGDSSSPPLLADYLLRGHALACAAGLDLERPIATWASAEHSLDERAWLSFGRQLAQSQPEDWQCLTFAAAGTQEVNKLYLRLGEHAWWSFQALLDRPSIASVNKQKKSLNRGRSKAVSTPSLKAIAPRLRAAEGRALRRAARAICARVGEPADSK